MSRVARYLSKLDKSITNRTLSSSHTPLWPYAVHDPLSSPSHWAEMLSSAFFLWVSTLFAVAQAVPRWNSSTPLYKNPNATVEARVEDLLSRMTIEDKTSQLIQGDLRYWINA